jgi:hypothetical protein
VWRVGLAYLSYLGGGGEGVGGRSPFLTMVEKLDPLYLSYTGTWVRKTAFLIYFISAWFFRFIRINRADVEVQTKVLEGGAKLTFMKFIFVSPSLEIKAPVLNDKAVGYQVGRPCLLKGDSLTRWIWHFDDTVWLVLGRPK